MEERKQHFKEKIWAYTKDKLNDFPIWLLKEFVEYWTSTNDNGHKMYFEMEKKWCTGLRLATWKRNTAKDERWKQENKIQHPNYYSKKHSRNLNMSQHQEYKQHLIQLGFVFGGGSGGSWVKPPNNERIWI